jgi:hypothetical protein
MLPEGPERGAFRLGEEEFCGKAQIDDPRIPAAGQECGELFARIEREDDIRPPENSEKAATSAGACCGDSRERPEAYRSLSVNFPYLTGEEKISSGRSGAITAAAIS